MSSIVSNTYVGDAGPIESPIVFIGEAPGNTERELRIPFSGPSGDKLNDVMLKNGIERSSVRLANLCHYQPTGNDFDNLHDTAELKEGIAELTSYFKNRKVKPNVVVPLGTNPLKYITGISKGGITAWRGSILRSHLPGLEDVKIIPTFHPANILYDAANYPIFDLDMRRISRDSKDGAFNLPQRDYVIIEKNPILLESVVSELLSDPLEWLDTDIETFGPYLACIGFSNKDSVGYCIVWDNTEHTKACYKRLLESPNPKCFQFGTFDINYLHAHGYKVNNYSWDTMVAQHVMYPELPRSLAFLTSVHTREPFYKYEGRVVLEDEKSWGDRIDRDRLWKYNIKDHCNTGVIRREQMKMIARTPAWKKMFEFEMSMLPVAHSISQAGMRVDTSRLSEIRNETVSQLINCAQLLDKLTGNFPSLTRKKKQKSVVTRTQVSNILYKLLELPERKNKDGNLTTEEDALVSLLGVCVSKIEEYKTIEKKQEWRLKHSVLYLILKLRELEKLKGSYLDIKISGDYRVRSLYKVPATDTARWSCSKWVDDTGLNAQTFPRGNI